MTKLEKVLLYASKQAGRCSPYVWSGQGQKVKSLTVCKLAKMENSGANAARVMEFIYNHQSEIDKNSKIFDCSGFVICALQYAGVLPKDFDDTANGLMHSAYFAHVDFKDKQPGDLIFKAEGDKAYHVGIVTDAGMVTEAKGRAYGVVENRIDNVWNECRRPVYT